ncbi:hypothetical protein GCM10028808_61790 [Spirosoma migulaei]
MIQYGLNQEEHHRKRTFQDEYLAFLKRFEVQYDLKYVFDFYAQSDNIKPKE